MKDAKALVVRSRAHSVQMLAAAALFVLGLTLGIGGFVYNRTEALARSSDAVIHTQKRSARWGR